MKHGFGYSFKSMGLWGGQYQTQYEGVRGKSLFDYFKDVVIPYGDLYLNKK